VQTTCQDAGAVVGGHSDSTALSGIKSLPRFGCMGFALLVGYYACRCPALIYVKKMQHGYDKLNRGLQR
jgi:hypothetical protein